jgi:hypothetical protein
MQILQLILGMLILAFGRRLYWLFVGIVGFVVGMDLANRLFSGIPQTVILVIALVVGLIAAGLAVFFQRIALAIAGFFLGGYLAAVLIEWFGVNLGGYTWLAYILGGIIGVIFIALVFDWALIVLSSMAGATIILQALKAAQPLQALGLIALTVFGVLIQAGMLRRRKR